MITGALDLSVKPLMEHLGITEYVTNRLEFVNGMATGRLLPPVMAAATKASWIRTYTEREGHQPERLLRLYRQHERSADAVDRRSSGGDQPGYAFATNSASSRLADTEFEIEFDLNRGTALKTYGTSTPTKNTRIRNLHRPRQRAAHHAVRRGLYSRGLTDRNARALSESVDQGFAESRSGDPLRAESSARLRSALRATRAGNARDDRG